MKYFFTIPCVLALGAVLQGCGKSPGVTPIAQAVVDQPNCPAGQDRLWSALYREVEDRGQLPPASEVEGEVRSLAVNSAHAEALVAAYSSVAREIRFLGREAALVRLAEMEIGDRTTEEKRLRQDEIERDFARALSASETALGACPAPNLPAPTPAPTSAPVPTPVPNPGPTSPPTGTPDVITLFEGWRTRVAAPLYGAYKTMSVGYQSCNAVGVGTITSSNGSVSGITVTGDHPSGTGLAREVTDPDAVFRTNPYYSLRRSPASGCFGATTTPIIYDYGGKPYTSGGTIDLTKNGGTGTSALGIDCSGFVTTAVLTAGLRLKAGVTSKPAQSGGVNAAMYANPAGNGLTCFARIASTATQELASGDVVANTGHVVMVDRTGADPFGIAAAKTAEDCDKVAASKFAFTIVQSSPSKGGIGINRYRAADYLAGSSSMRTGLEAYAKSFCRVRLGLQAPTTLGDTAKAVVVRHLGGAACQDVRLPLAGEGCLQGCGTVTASAI